MTVIPINSEKYISFTKVVDDSSRDYKTRIRFKFIDSLRFMASSLEYLSSLIPSEKKRILRSEWKQLSDEKLSLLERKGVFCYDYVDSWDKLDLPALPAKDAFYSKLTGENISDDSYNFALKI